MEKYLVVIEKAQVDYSAFSRDLWGCVATGNTVDKVVIAILQHA